jgi:hypothetical protein
MALNERVFYRKRWKELSKHYDAFEKMYGQYPRPTIITPRESDGLSGYRDANTALLVRNYFGGKNDPLAEKYLLRAREICNDVLKANLFEQEPAVHLFPANRGGTRRMKAYLDALLDDKPLDRQLCIDSARDFAAYAEALPTKEWDSGEQDKVQEAIEALLLAGAVDEANQTIANSRAMRAMLIKERFAFSRHFAAVRSYPLEDDALRGEYLRIFDIIRDPDISDRPRVFPVGNFLRLTLAALYLKYFESTDGSFSWSRALEFMCE